MADKKFGVAFSGGGIRSAAFCSGVLRRLITKKKEPDFLSCVSGGGYTGSAYVQWKYHKGTQPGWTDAFFDHMRARTGHFCNWQDWFQGEGVESCSRNRSVIFWRYFCFHVLPVVYQRLSAIHRFCYKICHCCVHGGFLVFRPTFAQIFLVSYFDLCLLFCGVLAYLQGGFVLCKMYGEKIPKLYDCLFGHIRSVLGSWRFSTSLGSYIQQVGIS
jgi:hypothetical protein